MDSATGINNIKFLLLSIGILKLGNNLFCQMPNWDCHRFPKCIKLLDFQLKEHFGNLLCGLKFQIK